MSKQTKKGEQAANTGNEPPQPHIPPPQAQPPFQPPGMPPGMPDQMAMMSAMWNNPMMRMQMMGQMPPWMGMMGNPMGMMGMPPQQHPASQQSNNGPTGPSDQQAFLSLMQQQQQQQQQPHGMPLPQFNPMAAAMMMQNPFMNPMSMGGGMPIPQPHPAASSLGNGKNPFTAQGAPPAEIGTARGAKRAATNATQSSTKASKRANKKKVKGKPKRPLSAYNLFFKDERERILNDIPKKEEDDADNAGSNKEEEEKEEEGGGEGDANAIGVKPKKKPHGKIGFESLAKLIGKRWQELESVEVDKYKKLAEEDAKRYKAEMEVFLTKEANSEETDGGGEAKKRKLNSD